MENDNSILFPLRARECKSEKNGSNIDLFNLFYKIMGNKFSTERRLKAKLKHRERVKLLKVSSIEICLWKIEIE